jgi:hypothetical protein
VDPAKIVERKPAGHGGPMVLPLLTKGIREPGESPVAHARAQTAALDYGSADTLGVGLAEDWDNLHGLNLRRAVTRFAVLGGSVDLDEFRVASESIVQCCGNCGTVRRESVGSDLESLPGSCMADAFDKGIRGVLVALAKSDVQNQLSVALDSNEGIGVAEVLIIFGPHALLFFANEGSQFVAFHVPYFHVANLLGHDAFALFTGEYQKFENCGVVDFGDPLDGGNGISFKQELHDKFGLLDRQIHAV